MRPLPSFYKGLGMGLAMASLLWAAIVAAAVGRFMLAAMLAVALVWWFAASWNEEES